MGYLDTYAFYKPPEAADEFGVCGMGTKFQSNVQSAPAGAAGPAFTLFHVGEPGEPNYWPELAALATQLNAHFQTGARAALKAKMLSTGQKDLEVTVYIGPHGFQIAYAKALKKKVFGFPKAGLVQAIRAALAGLSST